jgi:hypothetical protein
MTKYTINFLIDNNFSKNVYVEADNDDEAIKKVLQQEIIESKLPVLDHPSEINIDIKILSRGKNDRDK